MTHPRTLPEGEQNLGATSGRSLSVTPYLQDADFTLWNGDALAVLRTLDDESATACVTSPPYLDARPEYDSPTVQTFADIFEQLARVLTDCCLVNVGRIWRKGIEQMWWLDLIRVAKHSGWHLLDTLVWIKPNANPIHGEVFANSHEYVLILGRAGDRLNVDGIRRRHAESTQARFGRAWTNHRGVKEPRESRARKTQAIPNPLGALPRSYVEVFVGREKGIKHPAPMALMLAEHLVTLAAKPRQTVLDPFIGSGTTAVAARKLGRSCIGIDNSEVYCAEAARRTQQLGLEAIA
jgi:adenine-specific DNA-methyltransferase